MSWILIFAYTAPVAYAALGETISQRAGVLNIGLEGTMLVGAFFAMLVAYGTHSPWLGLLVGTGAGLLVATVFAWFTVSLASDQVVVGTAINLLALGATGTLYRARFGQTGNLASVPKVPSWHGIDAVLILLLALIPLVTLLISRTAWGLAVRAAGEAPKAAEAAGFSVTRLRTSAVALGGALGGLGGAYLSVGIAGAFAENMTAGRGFVAIAMVTFGRWRPGFVCLAALLIGVAEGMQFWIQARGWKVPFQLMVALPYLIALLVLVIVGKGTQAPKSLGISYRRGR